MYLDSIICIATYKYQWMLWPFSLLLWKYWGRDLQIIYYGDRVVGELPPGVIFKPAPIMRERSDEHWSWEHDFGDGFASILRELSDPIVAISMPDMWLVDHVNLDMIDGMVRYMEARPNVVHAAMGSVTGIEPWQRCVETWEGMDIITVIPANNFNGGLMMNVALWNRKVALQLIKNTSILDSEVMGWKAMMERPDLMSVWVRKAQNMYRYAHILRYTEPDVAFLAGIPREEDRKIARAYIPDHMRALEV